MLGDRPVDITIKRVWQGLTFLEKTRLILQLLVTGITMPSAKELRNMVENLRKQTDLVSEAVFELGKSFPWIVESLIDERDQYMVIGLREVCPSRWSLYMGTTPTLLCIHIILYCISLHIIIIKQLDKHN